MWKAGLAGGAIAIVVIAAFLAIGCTTLFGAAICGIDRGRPAIQSASTVKTAARHAYYLRNGVPTVYRGRRNPFKATIGNVVEGARLYDLRCAVCHGTMGIGDGDGGERLAVPPADLSASLAQPLYGDDFFLWTISDGGHVFATDMPPFRNDLSEAEIWRILTFMRAAFAEQKATPAP
jgi:mono/diheme cytochrome c family protein